MQLPAQSIAGHGIWRISWHCNVSSLNKILDWANRRSKCPSFALQVSCTGKMDFIELVTPSITCSIYTWPFRTPRYTVLQLVTSGQFEVGLPSTSNSHGKPGTVWTKEKSNSDRTFKYGADVGRACNLKTNVIWAFVYVFETKFNIWLQGFPFRQKCAAVE